MKKFIKRYLIKLQIEIYKDCSVLLSSQCKPGFVEYCENMIKTLKSIL